MSVLWQFETSVWYQSLRECGDRYELERFYKNRDAIEVRELATARNSSDGGLFKYPARVDEHGTCVFELTASVPLLSLVVDPNVEEDVLTRLFANLASGLQGLHEISDPELVEPSNYRRLRHYLSTERDDAAGYLLSQLESSRVAAVRDLIDRDANQHRSGVHGGLSLGVAYVGEEEQIEVPTGPEAGVFNSTIDIAWVVAELTELEHASLNAGKPSERYARLAKVFASQYEDAAGRQVDLRELLQLSTLRTTLHYLDFALTYPTLEPNSENLYFLRWLIDRAVA